MHISNGNAEFSIVRCCETWDVDTSEEKKLDYSDSENI